MNTLFLLHITLFFGLIPYIQDQFSAESPAVPASQEAGYFFPYDLSTYDQMWSLPRSLVEISGLSYDEITHRIAAINDEKGNVYFFDRLKDEISEKMDFGVGGDYEGVETVGEFIYITSSKGDVYSFNRQTMERHAKLKHRLA